MRDVKIHIRYGTNDPALLFDKVYSKMTPGRSGRWKNLVWTPDDDEADYICIIDYCHQMAAKHPPEKLIYMGSHHTGLKAYQDFSKTKAAYCFDVAHELGYCEWWISHTYDDLMAMTEPPKKTKDLIAIVSNQSYLPYHKWRKKLVRTICDRPELTGFFDLYGRIKPEGSLKRYYRGELGNQNPDSYWFGKEGVYTDAKYSLELDGGPTSHYFSERFMDAMLLWSMPIYWGGDNVHDYLPEESFRYIDIHGDGSDVLNIARSDAWERNLDAISEARQLLLNKHQIWPKLHEIIEKIS